MQEHGVDGKENVILYTALKKRHEQIWKEEKQRDPEVHGGITERLPRCPQNRPRLKHSEP